MRADPPAWRLVVHGGGETADGGAQRPAAKVERAFFVLLDGSAEPLHAFYTRFSCSFYSFQRTFYCLSHAFSLHFSHTLLPFRMHKVQ